MPSRGPTDISQQEIFHASSSCPLRCRWHRAVRHRNRQPRRGRFPRHQVGRQRPLPGLDESVPTKPWPDNYKALSRPVATFDGAVAVKAHLPKKGVCKL
jgi:hypothetical protein